MRSTRAKHSLIAVSGYQMETALNTFQDLDLALLASVGDMIERDTRREDNKDELTGMEEADMIYDRGQTSSLTLNFPKAQPQHFAFLLAYALGSVTSTAAGTGYLHTITPLTNDLEQNRSLPSFTAAQRIGKIIGKERWASMFVDAVTATFSRDDFLKVVGTCKGTGKMEKSITEETVSAAANATTLTLAANGVAGATAQERLDSIHQVRAELDSGIWTEVEVTAVSDAEPAELTITAPDTETDSVSYKVLYAPDEVAWMTFPARVSETPMEISQMSLILGGAWDGSAFQGGKTLSSEISSIEYKLNNSGTIEFTPGSDGAYASNYFREQREQTLSLDREFRDYILQNYLDTNETFGAEILAEGMEYTSGHKYTLRMIFPKLGVLSAPRKVDGKKIGETGDLRVLQDATYGSVIVQVKNKQATYAG